VKNTNYKAFHYVKETDFFFQEMEAKPDSSNAQKYESGTGDMETQATLALSYF
jgi:hypothetical protein